MSLSIKFGCISHIRNEPQTIYFQSWPKIEKFKFRLGSVISGLASLKRLTATIMEDSGILTDQLLGAFGPKLKEIVITGEKLHTISWEALEGMYFNDYMYQTLCEYQTVVNAQSAYQFEIET